MPYDEKVRLAEIISDARALLAAPMPAKGNDGLGLVQDWPSRCGQLEAMLTMLANSAEIVAGK